MYLKFVRSDEVREQFLDGPTHMFKRYKKTAKNRCFTRNVP
jgi:hypothetical protein